MKKKAGRDCRRMPHEHFHNCDTTFECLLQEVEQYITESEGQEVESDRSRATELIGYSGLSDSLSPGDVDAVADKLQECWHHLAFDYWIDALEEIQAEVQVKFDKWSADWEHAVEEYLSKNSELSDEDKEHAYDLMTDEEDGMFLAIWEEAIGVYEG